MGLARRCVLVLYYHFAMPILYQSYLSPSDGPTELTSHPHNSPNSLCYLTWSIEDIMIIIITPFSLLMSYQSINPGPRQVFTVRNKASFYVEVLATPRLSGLPRWGGLGVSNPPPHPPKFRSFYKAGPNSQFRGKYIRNNLIRIRVSLICKLSGTAD
jgi:hypothetical protein